VGTVVRPGADLLERREESRPPVARAAVRVLVLGAEARLLDAHQHAALDRRQRPGDDGPQSALRLVAGRVPRVGESPARFDHEDLAIDDAVPSGYGLGAETE